MANADITTSNQLDLLDELTEIQSQLSYISAFLQLIKENSAFGNLPGHHQSAIHGIDIFAERLEKSLKSFENHLDILLGNN